jgi:trehalose 6-phosphate phosphatase
MESEIRRPSPPLPAHDWALFLDVDGCLLDFAPHPSGVIVPDGLQQHILRLAAKLDGALALVSGRSLDAIDAVFDELRALPAAGMHGLERRESDGRRTDAPDAPDSLKTVEAEAQRIAAGYPGAIAERKGPNLALQLARCPHRAGCLPRLRRGGAARAARLPRARRRPRARTAPRRRDARQGQRGRRLPCATPFRGRTPVFVGDDLTDEHAFAVVNARSGLSVLVGPRLGSAAGWHLADPAAVRAWIARAVVLMECMHEATGEPGPRRHRQRHLRCADRQHRQRGVVLPAGLRWRPRVLRPALAQARWRCVVDRGGALRLREQHYVPNTAILTTILRDHARRGVEITDFAPRWRHYNRLYRPVGLFRRVRPLSGRRASACACNRSPTGARANPNAPGAATTCAGCCRATCCA